MQRRHHQVGSINQRLIKLKQGQKTAFPFPLMFSPCLAKGTHLFLEPLFPTVFYPPTFCLPPETELRSFICTLFYSYVYGFGLHSVLVFTVLWLIWKQFYKNVLSFVLSDFMCYIKYLLLVLFGSAVGIGYIVRHKLNYCIYIAMPQRTFQSPLPCSHLCVPLFLTAYL